MSQQSDFISKTNNIYQFIGSSFSLWFNSTKVKVDAYMYKKNCDIISVFPPSQIVILLFRKWFLHPSFFLFLLNVTRLIASLLSVLWRIASSKQTYTQYCHGHRPLCLCLNRKSKQRFFFLSSTPSQLEINISLLSCDANHLSFLILQHKSQHVSPHFCHSTLFFFSHKNNVFFSLYYFNIK